jgi:CHAD domain-containing protein
LRDLDVYLLKEETYRSRLPVALRKDIDLLFEYLKQKRTLALQEVIQGLDSEGYSQILADWETFLNMPPQDTPNTPNANRPIKEVAQQRINKRYRGAIKLGNRIIAMRDYEQLHYLRIECKKLRYLMEFFSSLFHTKKITTLINQLKKLQDNLGDYNDLCMQQEYLLNIANEIDTSEPESKMTLLAIGSLIGSMEDERQRVRESFDQIFSKFAASKNKAIARELFSSKTKKAAS